MNIFPPLIRSKLIRVHQSYKQSNEKFPHLNPTKIHAWLFIIDYKIKNLFPINKVTSRVAEQNAESKR